MYLMTKDDVCAAAQKVGPLLKRSVQELSALAWLRFKSEHRDREIAQLPIREEARENPAKVILSMLEKK